MKQNICDVPGEIAFRLCAELCSVMADPIRKETKCAWQERKKKDTSGVGASGAGHSNQAGLCEDVKPPLSARPQEVLSSLLLPTGLGEPGLT